MNNWDFYKRLYELPLIESLDLTKGDVSIAVRLPENSAFLNGRVHGILLPTYAQSDDFLLLSMKYRPQLFNIFWDLPLTLIVLGKSRKLLVNPKKAERILDYLLHSLISLFPRLHSNRLYLLLGIESVLKEIDYLDLRKHALFLKRSIDMDTVFNAECKNLNIGILDGVSGLWLIGGKLLEITGDNSLLPSYELIYNKITKAACWGDADFYNPFKKSIGLVSGLSGIGLALLDSLELVKKSDIVKV